MTTQAPLSAPPTPKKPWLLLIGILVILALFVVGALAALNGIGKLFSGVGANGNYVEKFAAYQQVNKKFTIGQTMEFGSLDITATSVSRNMAPSAEELAYLQQRMTQKASKDYYGSFGSLDDLNTQYVQIRLTATYNATRDTHKAVIFSDIDPFENAVNAVDLNGVAPLLYWVNGVVQPYYRPGDTVIAQLKTGQPVELTYLYKVPPVTEGVATATVTAFRKTSSIVGTEGMPREDITYSLQLW